jgi:hypothetical protein
MAMSLEYITNRMAEKKKAGLPMAMNQPTEDDSEVSYDEYKRRALEMGAKESGLATFDQYEEVRGRIGGALKKYKGKGLMRRGMDYMSQAMGMDSGRNIPAEIVKGLKE